MLTRSRHVQSVCDGNTQTILVTQLPASWVVSRSYVEPLLVFFRLRILSYLCQSAVQSVQGTLQSDHNYFATIGWHCMGLQLKL
jgi:hypothetical protein